MGSKVYAVRKGHNPGLYDTWPECQAATNSYKGALFKSFASRQEAIAWLAQGGITVAAAAPAGAGAATPHQPIPGGNSGGGSSRGKFYAVAQGRSRGIFQGSWSEVKQYVEGYSQAKFKAFDSRQEAEQYMQQQQQQAGATGAQGRDQGYPAKRQRSSSSKSAYEQPPPPAFQPGVVPAAAPAAAAAAAGVQVPPLLVAGGSSSSSVPQVSIYFDGGSRGNPGRAGYGYAVFDRGTNDKLRMGCRPLPFGSTNNEAEYSGMIAGMRYALEVLQAKHLVVLGDSELVVKQMKGLYKVNGERLLPLYREAKQLEQRCSSFEIDHIYREANSLADRLSNLAMDTDLVVDQIGRAAAGPGGSSRSRRAVVMQLATAAQLDQDAALVAALCRTPCFLTAAADTLSRLWDNLPAEEVLTQLQAKGWNESIGSPPELPPAPGAAAGADEGLAAAGAATGGAGAGAGVVAAAAGGAAGVRGGVRTGRGQQAVAVAAVRLGSDWAGEIHRQEALMHRQQQQGAGTCGSGRRSSSTAGHRTQSSRLDQQQQRQRVQAAPATDGCSSSNSSRRQQRCHCSGLGCLGCVGGVSKRPAHCSPAVQLSVISSGAGSGGHPVRWSKHSRALAWGSTISSRSSSASLYRGRQAASPAAPPAVSYGGRSGASSSRAAVLRVLQRAAPPAVRAAGMAAFAGAAAAAAAARMANSNRPRLGVRSCYGALAV